MKNYIKGLSILFFVTLLFSCSTSNDGNGNSSTTVVPVTPSNLTGTVASTVQINLSWTDNSTNETAFKIERKTGTGTYVAVASTAANTTTYNDIGLTPNTAYTYRVYANNAIGNSLTYSNELTLTTTSAINLPAITTTVVSTIGSNTAVSGGNITSDGGGTILTRGIVWNTITNPTIDLTTKTIDGLGTGLFTSNISGLSPNTTYYVRAYATNSVGIAYGNEVNFTTQNINYATLYPTGTVFCNNVVTAVVDVTNPVTGKTWMDRNLGASQLASSSTDVAAYGDLYQWGRRSDGHQCRNSPSTSVLNNSDVPPNGFFISVSSEPKDWRSPQNPSLWQDLNGVNNPCPSGYRLPTLTEFEAEVQTWLSNVPANERPMQSILKLPNSGFRKVDNSGIIPDVARYYTSSSVSAGGISTSYCFYISGSSVITFFASHLRNGDAMSVRCIKN